MRGAAGSDVAGSGVIVAVEGSGAGVSSTVECLPVVHGGISRNSSKVRTRGLQHFQPFGVEPSVLVVLIYHKLRTQLTFLTLVEYWRARVVDTWLFRVAEDLAATFVNALGCHFIR